jgi:hypothetical protein
MAEPCTEEQDVLSELAAPLAGVSECIYNPRDGSVVVKANNSLCRLPLQKSLAKPMVLKRKTHVPPVSSLTASFISREKQKST